MRLLVSLQGSEAGFSREAIAQIGHDALHLLATDPESEEVETVVRLARQQGANVRVDAVPADDLLGAFTAIRDALDDRRSQATELCCQVNAGKDANILSAAGLLACLHVGVEATFLHEKGRTELPVLTRAPLRELLNASDRSTLSGFPNDGLPVDQVRGHDAAALSRLRDRSLIELLDGALHLTGQGQAFREHVRERLS